MCGLIRLDRLAVGGLWFTKHTQSAIFYVLAPIRLSKIEGNISHFFYDVLCDNIFSVNKQLFRFKCICVLTIRYLSAIILRTIATFADVNSASLVFKLERYDSYDILCHVHPGLQAYVIVQKLRVFSQSFSVYSTSGPLRNIPLNCEGSWVSRNKIF